MTVHVLAHVETEDFDRFLESFNSRGLRLRRKHGSQLAQVLRHRDDPNRVTLLFAWESEQAFRAFLEDPEVRETMRLGGTKEQPEATLLDLVEELPH